MSPRRKDCVSLLTCECSSAERAVLDEMKRAAGVASDANLARVALWSLADHLDLPMPNGVFDLHTWSGARGYRRPPKARTANPKVRQHEAPKRMPGKPAPDHPWRGQGLPTDPVRPTPDQARFFAGSK